MTTVAMILVGAPVWLPGFFTERWHAVVDATDSMTFHGMRLVWSVCGRAAVLEHDAGGAGELCDRCVFLAGPPVIGAGGGTRGAVRTCRGSR